MKRLFTLLVALAIVAGTAFANDNEGKKIKKADQIKLISGKEYHYRLIYPFKDEVEVEVTIKDEKGRTLVKESINNQEGFMRPYNLKGLSEGKYSMTIEDGEVSSVKEINLSDQKKMIVNKMDNGKFQVTASDLNASKLFISVYDEKENLLHQKTIDQASGFTQVFDLSKSKAQAHTFELTSTAGNAIRTTVK
jgi:hypothetical protein